MNLLSYPGSEYILDATLESMHAESVAWLKELDLWKDEMVFFYHILHHEKFSTMFPSAEMAEIEKDIVTLNVERLDRLRRGVAHHEQLLASVYRSGSSAEEQVYREAHKNLLHDIHSLHEDIGGFRRRSFRLLKSSY